MEPLQHENRAGTRPAATPSYARATAASEGRIIAPTCSAQRAKVQQRKTSQTRPLTARSMKADGASPPSSARPLAKRRARNGTGFFHLPGELRDYIYDFALVDCAGRSIDLYGSAAKPKKRTDTLLSLLCANDKIFSEVGSYDFINDKINIVIDQPDTIPFLEWIEAMGPINQRRLTQNENVTLRLV